MENEEEYKKGVDGEGGNSSEVTLGSEGGNTYSVGDEKIINQRVDSATKTDLDSATGSGIESAVGTQYSWNTNAADRANMAYQSDVLTAKQNYLQQRQNIEQQGQQMQTQYDMAQYSSNQSSEKVGWTGGYALDEKRQMDYLKATIQSQMYGSMELQKYGYDTSLAAARLAYDTNKYDLALEYYNTALSRAVTEAELTGVYVSPEANEMKSQYFAAEEKLKENPNDENAIRVKEATKNWFESNNISENGIYTFSALIELNTLYDSMWAALDDTYKNTGLYQLGSDTFINVNATKQDIALKGFDAFKINFNQMTSSDIVEYIKSDSTGRAAEQYLSSLDSAGDTMSNNIITRLKDDRILYESTTGTGENATKKYTTVHSADSIKQIIYSYIKDEISPITDTLQQQINKFADASEEDKAFIEKLFSSYEYKIDLGESLPKITVTISKEGETSITAGAKSYDPNANTNVTLPEGSGNLPTFETKEDLFKNLTQIDTKAFITQLENSGIDMEEVTNIITDMSSFTTEATGIGVGVGMLGGPIGVGAGALIGALVGSVMQYINSSAVEDYFNDAYDAVKTIKDTYTDLIGGKNNIKLLKELKNQYNDMTDAQKDGLTQLEKTRYLTAIEYYDTYNTLIDLWEDVELYSSKGDSTGEKFGEIWERYGDTFSKISESNAPNWQKGLAYAGHAVGGLVVSVVDTIWEGLKWAF